MFVPSGVPMSTWKKRIFSEVGSACGEIVRDVRDLVRLPHDIVPMVSPKLNSLGSTVYRWQREGRPFIYWDRGYVSRGGKTWLHKTPERHGHYRFHVSTFQMDRVRDVPGDRWAAIRWPLLAWKREGVHIVIAVPSDNYWSFHGLGDAWLRKTITMIRGATRRPIVVRRKGSRQSLQADLDGAHCLVTHGSNAAVEAVMLGCPVFVAASSAAALVGKTDIAEIEAPAYPDRLPWARSLAYSQWTLDEVVDGTMWSRLT